MGDGRRLVSNASCRMDIVRTIVHLISAGILLYLGASIVLLGAEVARSKSWYSIVILGTGGVLLLILAFRTLLERVEWAVDHVYYGDWFDDSKVMHDLELKLSNVHSESDVARILAEDLSLILKVRSSLLLIRASALPVRRFIRLVDCIQSACRTTTHYVGRSPSCRCVFGTAVHCRSW